MAAGPNQNNTKDQLSRGGRPDKRHMSLAATAKGGRTAAACGGTTYVTCFEVMRERQTGMRVGIAPAA